MAFDYSRLKATADRLIANFGKSASLIKKTKSGPKYAPVVTEVGHPVTVVDLGNKSIGFKDGRASQVREGANVVELERTLLMAVNDGTIVPRAKDCLIVDNETLVIWQVEIVKPGSTSLLYNIKIEN